MAVKWWLVGCVIVYFVMDACLLVCLLFRLICFFCTKPRHWVAKTFIKLPILGGT